jgi:hypothetical protein
MRWVERVNCSRWEPKLEATCFGQARNVFLQCENDQLQSHDTALGRFLPTIRQVPSLFDRRNLSVKLATLGEWELPLLYSLISTNLCL